ELIGALSFSDSEHPERFTARDLTQGTVLAGQVAQVLENSTLFQRVQQLEGQYRTMLEINKTLGQVHDLPTLLTTIAAEAARLLGVPEVIFRLCEGHELRLAGAWSPAELATIPVTLQMGEGLSGWVGQNGVPLLLNDITQDDRLLLVTRPRYQRYAYVAYLG